MQFTNSLKGAVAVVSGALIVVAMAGCSSFGGSPGGSGEQSQAAACKIANDAGDTATSASTADGSAMDNLSSAFTAVLPKISNPTVHSAVEKLAKEYSDVSSSMKNMTATNGSSSSAASAKSLQADLVSFSQLCPVSGGAKSSGLGSLGGSLTDKSSGGPAQGGSSSGSSTSNQGTSGADLSGLVRECSEVHGATLTNLKTFLDVSYKNGATLDGPLNTSIQSVASSFFIADSGINNPNLAAAVAKTDTDLASFALQTQADFTAGASSLTLIEFEAETTVLADVKAVETVCRA